MSERKEWFKEALAQERYFHDADREALDETRTKLTIAEAALDRLERTCSTAHRHTFEADCHGCMARKALKEIRK